VRGITALDKLDQKTLGARPALSARDGAQGAHEPARHAQAADRRARTTAGGRARGVECGAGQADVCDVVDEVPQSRSA
jgi:hypothetical protein